MNRPLVIAKLELPPPPGENEFLRCLSVEALSLLKTHLEFVELPTRCMIHKGGEPIKFSHFLNEGLASLVIESPNGDAAEIGMAGKETVAAVPGALSLSHSPVTEMMQIAGNGYRIHADKMRRVLKHSTEIRELFGRHEALMAMRLAQIAGCNAIHNAEQRLARWLLMVSDRVTTNPLQLAQEFISMMLGVTRQSVSMTLNALRQKGCIRVRRESIEIHNRGALKQYSCECYSIMKSFTLLPP